MPYDIKLSEALSVYYEGKYDVQVHWKIPNIKDGQEVDYFEVKLGDEAKNVSGKDYMATVLQEDANYGTNNASAAVAYVTSFDHVSLGDRYYASVQACSRLRCSNATVVERLPSPDNDASTDLHRLHYLPWTVAALLVLLALCAVVTVGKVLHRRAAVGSNCGSNKGGVASAEGYDMAMLKGLDDVDVLLDDDAVTVSDVFLGHGHFGVVRKGALKTADGRVCSVAVKSLRDRPSGRDLDEFLREILLMQKVGKHPNIVSMIGCCLDANRRCMLVVEYCQLGDLQTYLRKVRLYTSLT